MHSLAAVKYAWQRISAHWRFFFFKSQTQILCRLQLRPLTPIKTHTKRYAALFLSSPSPFEPCGRTIHGGCYISTQAILLLLALIKKRHGLQWLVSSLSLASPPFELSGSTLPTIVYILYFISFLILYLHNSI